MQKNKTKTKSISRTLAGFIKHPFIRKNKPILHTIEWVFILFAFFAIGLPIIYYQSAGNLFGGGKLRYVGNKESSVPPSEAEKKFIGETISEPVDTSGWDTYRNQWYGFEIKHPDSWTNMQYKTATTKNALYETIYKFRKDSSGENDPYIGFNVAIYSTRRAGSAEQTNDMQKNNDAPEDMSSCQFSEDVTIGEENNAFQKVSVGKDNACFEPTYFFSTKRGNYLYNIIPVAKDGTEMIANPEQDVNKNFPEYKEAVASLKFIPMTKPSVKAVPSKPRISAKRPVSAKIAGGRLVCAKKNDHPGKSQNGNKPGHMDMECCLDPDERPNPWCTYSNSIYQKYLK
ncbi:MAG: hypothetical protein WC643_04215 [Parcubacteria group bacterium]|jgi:hypothetical protein